MEIKKAAGALGVEVRGMDLAHMANDPDFVQQVRGLVTEHGVAFFRGQSMDVEGYAAGARQLGEIPGHQAYEKGYYVCGHGPIVAVCTDNPA